MAELVGLLAYLKRDGRRVFRCAETICNSGHRIQDRVGIMRDELAQQVSVLDSQIDNLKAAMPDSED